MAAPLQLTWLPELGLCMMLSPVDPICRFSLGVLGCLRCTCLAAGELLRWHPCMLPAVGPLCAAFLCLIIANGTPGTEAATEQTGIEAMTNGITEGRGTAANTEGSTQSKHLQMQGADSSFKRKVLQSSPIRLLRQCLLYLCIADAPPQLEDMVIGGVDPA